MSKYVRIYMYIVTILKPSINDNISQFMTKTDAAVI